MPGTSDNADCCAATFAAVSRARPELVLSPMSVALNVTAPVRPATDRTASVGVRNSIQFASVDTLKDTLKSLALAAIVAEGALPGDTAAQSGLLQAAGQKLMSSNSDLADLRGNLGSIEGHIAEVETRNGAETTALQLARGTITAADPYETGTALEAAQTQLEAVWSAFVPALAQAVAKVAAWQPPMRLNDTTRAYFERLATISAPDKASRYNNIVNPRFRLLADDLVTVGFSAMVFARGIYSTVAPDHLPVNMQPGHISGASSFNSQPGALGIHLDKHNQPFALVTASSDKDVWSLTASHELAEMIVDPFGDRLVAGDFGGHDRTY